MTAAVSHKISYDLLFVVDPSDRRERPVAELRVYSKRLRIAVAYRAYTHVAGHSLELRFELAPERRVLDVVDRSVESVILKDAHSASLCPKMRMIVSSEEDIHHTVLLRGYSEYSSHYFTFLSFLLVSASQAQLLCGEGGHVRPRALFPEEFRACLLL